MYEMLTTPVLDRAQWKSRLHDPVQRKYLYFPPSWPSNLSWLSGKYFQITKTVIVNYPFDRTIPGDDQIFLNLSNNVTSASGIYGLNLYPSASDQETAYEILVGMKPGNFQIGLYIPGTGDYLLSLGASGMRPDLTDVDLRNLGTIQPEDSPFEDPLLKLWAVGSMQSLILLVDMLPGVDFAKAILRFIVAKHKIAALSKPPDVFTTIQYYKDERGSW